MFAPISLRLPLVAAFAALTIAASPSEAPFGCRLDEAATSQLRVYECQEKLRIAAEAATRLSAIQRSGRLVGVRVEGGAVLVETGGRSEAFQIVTAQAVTEAREGRVAVETTTSGTAVFVRDGGATVSRDGGSVALRPGEGVDVASVTPASAKAPAPGASDSRPRSTRSAQPGTGGLAVQAWGAKRADGLMARLGQR